jgi:hypothetical protein
LGFCLQANEIELSNRGSMKREHGTDGINGTNGKRPENTLKFPFVPFIPSVPCSPAACSMRKFNLKAELNFSIWRRSLAEHYVSGRHLFDGL